MLQKSFKLLYLGWVLGAVALACFLMGTACFTLKYTVNSNKQPQTWIQRRLSKAQPQVGQFRLLCISILFE